MNDFVSISMFDQEEVLLKLQKTNRNEWQPKLGEGRKKPNDDKKRELDLERLSYEAGYERFTKIKKRETSTSTYNNESQAKKMKEIQKSPGKKGEICQKSEKQTNVGDPLFDILIGQKPSQGMTYHLSDRKLGIDFCLRCPIYTVFRDNQLSYDGCYQCESVFSSVDLLKQHIATHKLAIDTNFSSSPIDPSSPEIVINLPDLPANNFSSSKETTKNYTIHGNYKENCGSEGNLSQTR